MSFMRLILFFFLSVTPFTLQAAYLLDKGKLVDREEAATLSVQEHYSAAINAYQKKKWNELVKQAIIVTKNFESSPFAQEALFYLAVGYFHQEEYDLANEKFSAYLKKQTTPKHFEEAIEYKFAIAEKFQKGAKKHILGWKTMPKWIPAREEALEIFDEVIMALPHHELGAKALFGKARLLFKDEDYKASIETYQALIRRFPKHELSVQSYLGIGEVYLAQCQNQYPDPDFLDLAEINLRKFRQDFPQNEQITQAEKTFMNMQGIYAANLYETAQFFERTKKPHAAIIYYTKVSVNYPHTEYAVLSQKRLKSLQPTPKPEPKTESASALEPKTVE
jgi:outer membrane protein assembly factor BamD (BamD/ComL family)